MKKKTYIRPAIEICSFTTKPIMNLGSYCQAPIDGDIQETSEDDIEGYWGY